MPSLDCKRPSSSSPFLYQEDVIVGELAELLLQLAARFKFQRTVDGEMTVLYLSVERRRPCGWGDVHTRTRGLRGANGKCMQRSHPQDAPPDAPSWLNKVDDFTRRQPTKAVASAGSRLLIVIFYRFGAIVGGLVSVSFALIRPALLFFGLVKAFEFLRPKSTHQN